jgi:hypothetical protein
MAIEHAQSAFQSTFCYKYCHTSCFWATNLPTQGGRKNKTGKRRTSAPARKKRYVRTFFISNIYILVRFWAFLGKGSSKTRGKQLIAFPKKLTGKCFFGGDFFPPTFFVALGSGSR